MEGLSINNIITNEDITITYTPSVINYSYVIIKNNVYGNPVVVNDGSISEIKLTDEGSYKIEVTTNGNVSTSGEYVIDKTAPVLTLEGKKYIISNKEKFNFFDKVTASDSNDGD